MRSCKNFSNEAGSNTLSLTGTVQSMTNFIDLLDDFYVMKQKWVTMDLVCLSFLRLLLLHAALLQHRVKNAREWGSESICSYTPDSFQHHHAWMGWSRLKSNISVSFFTPFRREVTLVAWAEKQTLQRAHTQISNMYRSDLLLWLVPCLFTVLIHLVKCQLIDRQTAQLAAASHLFILPFVYRPHRGWETRYTVSDHRWYFKQVKSINSI